MFEILADLFAGLFDFKWTVTSPGAFVEIIFSFTQSYDVIIVF